jgi:hypothetical protein
MQLKQIKTQVTDRLYLIPSWRLKVYGGIVLLALLYFAWSLWGERALKPGSVVISAPVAPQIAKMETTYAPPIRLIVIKDKAKAVEKLGLPSSEAMDPKEALLTATAVRANRYGATVVTFANQTTGQVRSSIVVNKAPWFALERTNYVGGSVGIGVDGYVGRIYAKRDLAQVKGNYLQVEIEAIARPTAIAGRTAEGVLWLNIERRFDWP